MGCIWELSVTYAQFSYEHKNFLKNKFTNLKVCITKQKKKDKQKLHTEPCNGTTVEGQEEVVEDVKIYKTVVRNSLICKEGLQGYK